MKKLITLSDAQYETATRLMADAGIESFSEFVRYLIREKMTRTEPK